MYTCPRCQRYSVFISSFPSMARAGKTEEGTPQTCLNCSIRLIPEENLLKESFSHGLLGHNIHREADTGLPSPDVNLRKVTQGQVTSKIC